VTTWVVTLQYDDGVVRITTNASTKALAVRNVLDFENAPEAAVISVEKAKRRGAA
jgi:hypothetical protein